jgi:hypothetical protein
MNTASTFHIRAGRRKALGALALAVLVLTGCATAGDQARAEGTAAGAGIGAAVGAGLGYLIGRDAASAGIGAAIGAGIGGAGGYVYADRVARRHEALAGKEQDLDARIAFARGVNQDTEQYNLRLKNEVAELDARTADLQARTKQGTVSQQKLAEEKRMLATKVNDANKQLAVAQDELDGLKKFRAQQQKTSSKALDEQISALEANLAQMRASTTRLASLNQRI